MSNDGLYYKDDDEENIDNVDTSKFSEHELYVHEKKFPIPYTLKLAFPFEFGADTIIEEVVFQRRLNTKDLMTFPAENQQIGHLVKLVSKTTVMPMAQLDRMDSSDLFKCVDVVSTFLAKPPQTGKQS